MLTPAEKYFPLQILNPDENNNTAIHLAVSVQNFKSVECMMRLLIDFPEISLSKLLLGDIK